MSKTGIIYKLVSDDVEIKECYVGSTVNFIRRKHEHKSNCNNINSKRYNLYVYKFIRDNGGWNSYSMIQIEEYKFNTRNELNARERHWIETLQAKLNKNIPTRTDKEYYESHKDEAKDYYESHKDKIKEYKLKNKELIRIKKKDYYKINKEIIKDKRKEYHLKNKDKRKEYHLKNKDKRKEYYQLKFKLYHEYLDYIQN